MKLERINDHQIRCTLNHNDLIDRELKISELAYGTDKAKALFKDLMLQANDELGFEVNDMPLIVEAIPVAGDGIILIITKVSDPEELDTRFSRFTPSTEYDTDNEADQHSEDTSEYHGADEILDLFKQLHENIVKELHDHSSDDEDQLKNPSSDQATHLENSSTIAITRIFSFSTLDDICTLAQGFSDELTVKNTLYKNPKNERYYLVYHNDDSSPEEFNRICNITTEYGQREKFTYATLSYYTEHYELIIANQALQILKHI